MAWNIPSYVYKWSEDRRRLCMGWDISSNVIYRHIIEGEDVIYERHGTYHLMSSADGLKAYVIYAWHGRYQLMSATGGLMRDDIYTGYGTYYLMPSTGLDLS